MKLNRENAGPDKQITACEVGAISVNGERFVASLIVTPEMVLSDWNVPDFAALTAEALGCVVTLAPALVLIGTGTKQRFPVPAVLRPLIEAGIGFEVMDTAAACRTYNLLAAEGRKVAAALVIES